MTEETGDLKTKIVCTLGPASRDRESLRRMAEAGMDVARVNSGHADFDEVRSYISLVRDVATETGARLGIMLDLQGPRVRVGSIQGSEVELKDGQHYTLTTEKKRGDDARSSVSYEGLPEDLKPGDSVLIDDGLLKMRVEKVSGKEIDCVVVEGGLLKQGKGMNFPGADLRLPAFTERDHRYLDVGLEAGIDWVAQSFVRNGEDVSTLKDAIAKKGCVVPVIAKIERQEAVRNIDSILEAADGVMVARGDMGVEMDPEEVPFIQKELITKAMRAAKPVVTATQMLESMVEKPRPTRAEASDVANAILDGSDALMLSAETAVGAFPAKTVEMMSRIAARAERAVDYDHLLEDRYTWAEKNAAGAIGYAACKMARDLGAKAIITVTRGGYTARMVARYRPGVDIFAVTPSEQAAGAMALLWGVRSVVTPIGDSLKGSIDAASEACKRTGCVSPGELVVVTGGFLGEAVGGTNTITLHTVD